MGAITLYAVCTLVLALVTGRVLASGYGSSTQSLKFGGRFIGSCDMDGMYFMDQSSYVICSHGIAYVMPCAPGTINSGRQLQMTTGDYLGFSTFCDVNLVDVGYAALVNQHQRAVGGGYGAPSTSGGYGGPAASSGYGGPAASSGYGGPTASSGYGGPAASSGYGAPASTSGYGATAPRPKPSGTLVLSYQAQPIRSGYGQRGSSGYGSQAGGVAPSVHIPASSTLSRLISSKPAANIGYQG